jgi:hypothetical protein
MFVPPMSIERTMPVFFASAMFPSSATVRS